MKSIPIVTTILILNNWYLNHLAESLAVWHAKLYRISGIEQQEIFAHTELLSRWKLDILGLALLSLFLVVLIWKNRLCQRWIAGAITALWVITFVLPFTRLP
jgi:hypothetical protein